MSQLSPDSEIIIGTLEHVADQLGDPSAAIYEALFCAHPELERLFALDRDGGVRASMVQHAFECMLDYVGPRLTSPQLIAAARLHHDGYGVPQERFDDFFAAMRDVFRKCLGADWTSVHEREWQKLLDAFADIR
jgi:hypothetical protein